MKRQEPQVALNWLGHQNDINRFPPRSKRYQAVEGLFGTRALFAQRLSKIQAPCLSRNSCPQTHGAVLIWTSVWSQDKNCVLWISQTNWDTASGWVLWCTNYKSLTPEIFFIHPHCLEAKNPKKCQRCDIWNPGHVNAGTSRPTANV